MSGMRNILVKRQMHCRHGVVLLLLVIVVYTDVLGEGKIKEGDTVVVDVECKTGKLIFKA